ncbi:hypothetical protein ILUMI_03195 [Ignelater luminosus]|uniref:Uncharacterized protein n=1 Tax=Ignelater luminosus TaxID=2038154 RepID=A0A8K0DF42_IGNLU|nr:hypothetical protein ILUMI_03195 [Ignelater luminosus]
MYGVILILSLVACTLEHLPDPQFWHDFNRYAAECVREEHVDANVVINAWDENHYPNKHIIKCYFKCITLKLGLVNENGEIIEETFVKVSQKLIETDDTPDEARNKCRSIKEVDACETGFKLMACIRNATIDG